MTRERTGQGPASTDAPTRPASLQGPTLEMHGSVPANVRVSLPPLAMQSSEQRYVEQEVLGEGGMGLVTLCEDLRIGRAVAKKTLRLEAGGHPEAELRFLREARVQGQLEHPAVVPVYDLGIEPSGSVFFTMKRVRGTTLHDVFSALRQGAEETGNHSRRRLLTAFGSVCLAVDFAHLRGVLHRDLKPANVMLGDFGEVYVLDWGLARVAGAENASIVDPISLAGAAPHQTQVGAVMGTPGYMAPEQMRGDLHALSPRTDVYSLGAILFELLTHLPLHDAPDVEGLSLSTLRGAEARPSVRAPERNVAPELEEIVVRATALDPALRFEDARELYQAIERFLDGERDQEKRRELAESHAASAEQQVSRAAHGTIDGRLSERRQALREIGRALALDPDNGRAFQLLVKLLEEPPLVLPREVRAELTASEYAKLRWVGRIAGIAYGSFVVYLPLLLWLGVKRWDWIAAFFAFTFAASAVSFWVSRQPRPSRRSAIVAMLLSNAGMAASAALFGPFFVTPMLVALNAVGYAMYFDRRNRKLAIAAALGAVLLPALGGLLGALPGGYAFGDSGILIRPGAVSFQSLPCILLLMLANVAAVLTGALSVTRVRDALDRSERQLLVYAWHLREFVPIAARAATDPSGHR